jgi:ssRNA-specific RNase YbeY (16S rRNA maturation enzyme)
LKIYYEGYFYRNEKFALENAKKEFLNYFEISENFIFYLHSVSEQQSTSFNMHYFKKDTPADVTNCPSL